MLSGRFSQWQQVTIFALSLGAVTALAAVGVLASEVTSTLLGALVGFATGAGAVHKAINLSNGKDSSS